MPDARRHGKRMVYNRRLGWSGHKPKTHVTPHLEHVRGAGAMVAQRLCKPKVTSSTLVHSNNAVSLQIGRAGGVALQTVTA